MRKEIVGMDQSDDLTPSPGSCAGSTLYSWSEDGVPIPGANAATYLIPASHPSGTFDFALAVSCSSAPSCSATAIVRVTIDPDDAPTVAFNSAVSANRFSSRGYASGILAAYFP